MSDPTWNGIERRKKRGDRYPPCPSCHCRSSLVLKGREAIRLRPGNPGRSDPILEAYRRWRICDDCGHKWPTLEQNEGGAPSDLAL